MRTSYRKYDTNIKTYEALFIIYFITIAFYHRIDLCQKPAPALYTERKRKHT